MRIIHYDIYVYICRVPLNYEKQCCEKFCHWFIPRRTNVGCWMWKILLQKYFSNHRKIYLLWLLKTNLLLKTRFLGKFKWFCSVFSIYSVNPTITTMKTPKHFLNSKKVKTWNGVKPYQVKMLNCLKKYWSNLTQNP